MKEYRIREEINGFFVDEKIKVPMLKYEGLFKVTYEDYTIYKAITKKDTLEEARELVKNISKYPVYHDIN